MMFEQHKPQLKKKYVAQFGKGFCDMSRRNKADKGDTAPSKKVSTSP